MGRWWVPLASAVAAATLAGGLDAAAPTVPPSIQDSFRLGGASGALCRVQSAVSGSAIKGMFDRAYAIVCRDAAAPIGHLYALRAGGDDPLARLLPREAPM